MDESDSHQTQKPNGVFVPLKLPKPVPLNTTCSEWLAWARIQGANERARAVVSSAARVACLLIVCQRKRAVARPIRFYDCWSFRKQAPIMERKGYPKEEIEFLQANKKKFGGV